MAALSALVFLAWCLACAFLAGAEADAIESDAIGAFIIGAAEEAAGVAAKETAATADSNAAMVNDLIMLRVP